MVSAGFAPGRSRGIAGGVRVRPEGAAGICAGRRGAGAVGHGRGITLVAAPFLGGAERRVARGGGTAGAAAGGDGGDFVARVKFLGFEHKVPVRSVEGLAPHRAGRLKHEHLSFRFFQRIGGELFFKRFPCQYWNFDQCAQ